MMNQFLMSLINGTLGSSVQKKNGEMLRILVVLPDKNDFSGKFQIKDIVCSDEDSLELNGEREFGAKAVISVEIFSSKDQKKRDDVFARYLPSEPVDSDRSFSGKRFGEKMYISVLESELGSFRRIVVKDGLSVISITMDAKQMIVTMQKNGAVYFCPVWADKLGVTSDACAKAP